MGIHLDALAPTEQRSRASPVKNDLISCSWLNFLRVWSILKTRGDSRQWVTALVRWYNYEQRHSLIRFVTPTQRHAGIDKTLLEKRNALYRSARQAIPTRWSGSTRNWEPITEVHLNPNKPKIMEPNNILKAT